MAGSAQVADAQEEKGISSHGDALAQDRGTASLDAELHAVGGSWS